MAEARCPVSLPKAKHATWGVASATAGAPLRVPARGDDDDAEIDNPDLADIAAEQFEPMEVRLDRERALAEVRRILEAEREAARLVLLAEEKSAEVAHRLGVSVREVYDQTAAATRALRAAFCTGVA